MKLYIVVMECQVCLGTATIWCEQCEESYKEEGDVAAHKMMPRDHPTEIPILKERQGVISPTENQRGESQTARKM